ncbi:DUF1904 family protein [Clostridioides difficile]|nr:DUF1904 domain-containing protein [Clostridioides difficile]MCP6778218.1 DUF1904 domain-containing protein [Clostridioides difficile]MDK3375512.1 DUF1904 family protein [Clostridioides difficile]MDS6261916.1 DUF1904 family protein [Clostridioides difficile]HBG1558843.1 DUF1904 family protein [Clostridioides difficile]
MPQIKIRGINENDICKISEKMIVYPFVEVAWFDRGQEVQDIVARIITDSIRNNLDVESMDLAFTVFEKEKYYENGEHF